MFSLICLHSYPHLESISIIYSEHWDCESNIMAACSILEPYYGIDTAVFFIRMAAPSQKHMNLMFIRSIKRVASLEVALFSADIRVEIKLNWIIPGKDPRKDALLLFFFFSPVSDEIIFNELKKTNKSKTKKGLTKLFIFLTHHSFWDGLALDAAGLWNIWFLRDPQSGCGLSSFLFVPSIWFENKRSPEAVLFEASPRKAVLDVCNSLLFPEELEGKKRLFFAHG